MDQLFILIYLTLQILIFILKAAIRAMDATQQFLRQQEVQVPEKFVVAGSSKVNQSIQKIVK